MLYEFPDSTPFVHFENYSSGAFVAESDDVEAYQKAIEMICRHALDPDESRKLIAQIVVREWSGTCGIALVKEQLSNPNGECVELSTTLDAIRDSKDPDGSVLRADVRRFVAAVKAGRFGR